MIGRLSQRKAVQRLSGVVSAKLLARRFFYATDNPVTDTVPAGAKRMVIRCYGGGGDAFATVPANDYSSNDGGAGAFARKEAACSAGAAVTIAVPTSYVSVVTGNSTTTALPGYCPATTVTYGGTVICSAAGGKGGHLQYFNGDYVRYYQNGGVRDGQASDCIGDIRISGSAGNAPAEPGAEYLLVPGKLGVPSGNSSLPGTVPGGGGKTTQNTGTRGTGICVIEYWSA